MNVEDVITPDKVTCSYQAPKLGRRSVLVVPVMSWHTKPETEIR